MPPNNIWTMLFEKIFTTNNNTQKTITESRIVGNKSFNYLNNPTFIILPV